MQANLKLPFAALDYGETFVRNSIRYRKVAHDIAEYYDDPSQTSLFLPGEVVTPTQQPN
jgi:hypothetical protein